MPLGETEKLLLSIAEKRFDVEEDTNKTLQQKAALLLTTVGFLVALLGQGLLRVTDQWRGGAWQWAAAGLLLLTLFVLLGAALGFVSAIFGSYSTPAVPRAWRELVEKSRDTLNASQDANAEDQVLDHLHRSYFGALSKAAEEAAAANSVKSHRIETAATALKIAAVIACLALLAFLGQAIAEPSDCKEHTVSEETPAAASPSAPAASEGAPAGSDAPAASSPAAALPAAPENEVCRKSELGNSGPLLPLPESGPLLGGTRGRR